MGRSILEYDVGKNLRHYLYLAPEKRLKVAELLIRRLTSAHNWCAPNYPAFIHCCLLGKFITSTNGSQNIFITSINFLCYNITAANLKSIIVLLPSICMLRCIDNVNVWILWLARNKWAFHRQFMNIYAYISLPHKIFAVIRPSRSLNHQYGWKFMPEQTDVSHDTSTNNTQTHFIVCPKMHLITYEYYVELGCHRVKCPSINISALVLIHLNLIVSKSGRAGADGISGKDGKDGIPGLDGRNGINGKDGTCTRNWFQELANWLHDQWKFVHILELQ